MPTFIKAGFWNKKKYKLNGELDLDRLIETFISSSTTTTTTTTQPPYKVYTATISQTDTSAPIVNNEFQNTIGEITFSYKSPGQYLVNSNELFIENKTSITLSVGRPSSGVLGAQYSNKDALFLYSSNNLGKSTNGIINLATLEIRVYN